MIYDFNISYSSSLNQNLLYRYMSEDLLLFMLSDIFLQVFFVFMRYSLLFFSFHRILEFLLNNLLFCKEVKGGQLLLLCFLLFCSLSITIFPYQISTWTPVLSNSRSIQIQRSTFRLRLYLWAVRSKFMVFYWE